MNGTRTYWGSGHPATSVDGPYGPTTALRPLVSLSTVVRVPSAVVTPKIVVAVVVCRM